MESVEANEGPLCAYRPGPMAVVALAGWLAACGDNRPPDSRPLDASFDVDASQPDTPDASTMPDASIIPGPDAGPGPDAMPPDAMPPDAMPPDAMPSMTCGDGIQDPGETCDDGNTMDGDGCNATCMVATCLVPVSHATIAAGLADAICSTLYIYSGTYHENTLAIAHDVDLVGVGTAPVEVLGTTFTIDVPGLAIGMHDFTIHSYDMETEGGAIRATQVLDLDLQNMVIYGGYSTGNDNDIFGGAIHADAGGNLTLSGSTIRDNDVAISSEGVMRAYGGAIYWLGGTITVRDGSIIDNNRARSFQNGPTGSDTYGYGGGIYAINTDIAILGNSQFTNNSSNAGSQDIHRARGGAIYLSGGSLSIDSSDIVGNKVHASGGSGGAIYLENSQLSVTGQSNITGNLIDSVRAPGYGGAIYLYSTDASISDGSVLSDNGIELDSPGAGYGGAIYHLTGSQLTIADTVMSNNHIVILSGTDNSTPVARGGAIYSSPNSPMTLRNVTLSGNTAQIVGAVSPRSPEAQGGAIYARYRILAERCTFSSNLADARDLAEGGAIYATSASTTALMLIADNSTFSGNTATSSMGTASGGGIHVTSPATVPVVQLSNVTIAANAADDAGGGIHVQTHVTVRNTIIADNSAAAGPDCQTGATHPLTSAGYNLVTDTAGCTRVGDTASDITGVAAGLLTLADNGGATQTHLPMANSRPIDNGNPAGCTDYLSALLTTDQRGLSRPAGVRCDIGAVEIQP